MTRFAALVILLGPSLGLLAEQSNPCPEGPHTLYSLPAVSLDSSLERIKSPDGSKVLTVSSAPQNDSNVPCSSYQQCNDMGTKALQAGKTNAAVQLFELQAGYAEIADIEQGHVDVGPGKTPSYTLGINAYNNLAVAYMHKGDYLRARLWCHVALNWDKENKTALYNLGQIAEKLKQWRWPESVTGMYLRTQVGDNGTACALSKMAPGRYQCRSLE